MPSLLDQEIGSRRQRWFIHLLWDDAARILSLAILLAVGTLCSRARSSSFSWSVSSGGSFTDPTNWNYLPVFPPDSDGVPDSNDVVTSRRGLGNAYTVTFPGGGPIGTTPVSYHSDRLLIGSNDATLSDSLVFIQSSYTIDNTDTSASGRGIVVGVTASDTAAVLTSTLPLNGVAATIGDAAGSVGTLNVNGRTFALSGNNAATGSDGTELLIGNNGAGTFNVNNGAVASLPGANADVWMALSPGSLGAANISGSGSTWTIGRELDIGVGGNATLNVTGGGHVSDAVANLAYDSGSTGTVFVSGDGSTWNTSGNLVVGYSADGAMTIAAGGQVTSGTGSIQAFGAHTAMVTVDGTGSDGSPSKWTVNGRLDVGRSDGSNKLDILSGGQVSDNFSYIAPAGGSNAGTVTVDGANSQWTNSGNLIIAEGGPDGQGDTGSLAITNGGQVRNSTACVGCGAGASGTVTVAGANSNWHNTALLYVGEVGDGSLNISAGGSINADSVYIGNNIGSTGIVSISGSGSEVINSSTFIVGEQGNGTVNIGAAADEFIQGLIVGDLATGTADISDATLHTGGEVDVANFPGSRGTVMLTNGGMWDHSGSTPSDVLVVGKYGGGELDVLSGSQMKLQGQAPLELGQKSNSQGIVNVVGSMSQLSVELQYVDVGEQGTGAIHVTAGGSVMAANSDVGVAIQGGSSGQLSLDGANSSMQAGMVEIGRAGMGELHVLGRANLSSPVITFASATGSQGTGTVDGADSKLSAMTGMGQIIVGGNDQASLTISGGALAEALQVIIGDGNNANGTMVVTGSGAELHAVDEVLVGFSGVGSLTISAGASVVSPIVAISDQSSLNGNGTIVGNVENQGRAAPGASPGALHIDGNYMQSSTGRLQIEIGGLVAGSEYDQLLVTGEVTLDGTMQVAFVNNFTPAIGNSFNILDFVGRTGTFATLDLPSLDPNLAWNTTQLYSGGILSIALAGDFNDDGMVDAADYITWRKGLGTTYTQNDYDVWRSHFGQTAGGGAVAIASGTVPQPTGILLLILGAALVIFARYRVAVT